MKVETIYDWKFPKCILYSIKSKNYSIYPVRNPVISKLTFSLMSKVCVYVSFNMKFSMNIFIHESSSSLHKVSIIQCMNGKISNILIANIDCIFYIIGLKGMVFFSAE